MMMRPFSSSNSSSTPAVQSTTTKISWMERIRTFPRGVLQLWYDALRIKDMYDAANTRNNAWNKSTAAKGPRLGRLPRRQQEQERQFIQSVRIVLPVILLWIPPIIGYIPMFCAILLPRQSLSTHFMPFQERHLYAKMEFQQRLVFFPLILRHVKDLVKTTKTINELISPMPPPPPSSSGILPDDRKEEKKDNEERFDLAGPLLDLGPLFDAFCHGGATLCHVDSYPYPFLQQFALALGWAQRFPPPLAEIMANLSGRTWIKQELLRLGFEIWRDDGLLLEENYHLDQCHGMTDQELVEACLMRGLPVVDSFDQMRECLTNHLLMVQDFRSGLPKNTERRYLHLFILFVPILRHQHKR